MTLPKTVMRRLSTVERELEELYDQIEDYLDAHDRRLLRQLRQARKEHLAGQTRPFEAVWAELYKKRS